MNGRLLGRIILFGTFVLSGLLILQVYWFKKAFDVAEKQFDHRVQVALKKVADSISREAEIRKLSSNFYFVATESRLNNQELDKLISTEFLLHRLNTDYELGVYNADDDTLLYGNYVEATRPFRQQEALAVSDGNEHKNFAIYFPRKESYVLSGLDIWIYSTVALLFMMGFFAYSIFTLLREKRFSELKNDFINNMTHEFKTPVTNIGIAGEILRGKIPEGEGLRVYVDILLKENEKLRDKIDRVLLGSSAELLKRPELSLLDVHELITDCAEAFRLKLEERQGQIHFDFNAANISILGDRELLSQAINNVIDNAEKYSPSSPRIVVRTRDHGNGIAIEIEDNGIGISPDMRSRVFDKFFRVRSGNIHNVKGFGLGLSFVKSVIQSHRGKVNLLSEVNKGTEVQIFLPVS